MAVIEPFRGLLFRDPSGQDHGLCAAPPYDVITATERERFAARSAANVVHLTLPVPAGNLDRYASARKMMERMIEDGRLAEDSEPTFYLQDAHFVGPSGQPTVRRGLFGLVEIETLGTGAVRGHEQVMRKPLTDRYRLMSATRANLEPVFLLYPDLFGVVDRILEESRRHSPLTVTELDGVRHELRRASADATRPICDHLSSCPLYVADGHHRYTVADRYRLEFPDQSGARYRLALLVRAFDPGLVVLPTHRFVPELSEEAALRIHNLLEEHFELQPTTDDRILADLSDAADTDAPGPFAARLRATGLTAICKPRHTAVAALADLPALLGNLDVIVLHRFLLDPGRLGFEVECAYVRGEEDPVGRARAEGMAAAFYLNPPSVETVLDVSDQGLTMPPKSTYFWPKAASGQVAYGFEL